LLDSGTPLERGIDVGLLDGRQNEVDHIFLSPQNAGKENKKHDQHSA
jgi:hypothetical protein